MRRLRQACLATGLLFAASCALNPAPVPTRTTAPTATAVFTPTGAPPASDTPTPAPQAPPTAAFTITGSPTTPHGPLACGAARGTLEDGSVRSPRLEGNLHFRIYLPPCYEQARAFRYPVIYLFHGLAANERQWTDLGLDETADRLIAAGEVYPFMAVLPRDRGEASLGAAVLEDLRPHIDATYRSLPDRRHRAVGGISRGGGWAIFLGLQNATVFGALAGHSPAIQPYQAELIIPILRALPERDFPRVYFDIGERDSLKPDNTDWLEARLTERGMPFDYVVNPGDHLASYWVAHMEEYLRFYAAEWP